MQSREKEKEAEHLRTNREGAGGRKRFPLDFKPE
jgi:hypothetical protein